MARLIETAVRERWTRARLGRAGRRLARHVAAEIRVLGVLDGTGRRRDPDQPDDRVADDRGVPGPFRRPKDSGRAAREKCLASGRRNRLSGCRLSPGDLEGAMGLSIRGYARHRDVSQTAVEISFKAA